MAKTRSRRGARRNLTRRGGGKESGGMDVEGSKSRSVKAKSMKHGAKEIIHKVIRKKGSLEVTGANIAFDKKQRAEEKAKKYLQKYLAAKAKAEKYLERFHAATAKASTAAKVVEQKEGYEDEDEEGEDEDEEDEDEQEEGGKKPFMPYVPNGLDNGMNKLLNALEENAVKNNNSQ